MPVNSPRLEYEELLSTWKKCRDCYDGSKAVKDAGDLYLPRLASHAHHPKRYEDYKARATFYNAFCRTVDGLSGAVFQKEPAIKIPKHIEEHLIDIDLTGTPFETFALQALREVLISGRFGILIDMLEEDKEQPRLLRPYWTGHLAENIISWRTERRGSDPEVLTRVVLAESFDSWSSDDSFELERIKRFRVLELDDSGYFQTIWIMKDGEWMIENTIIPVRRGERLFFIPFVFVNPVNISPKPFKPPLSDLADINLGLYKNSADHEHGLHFTAMPTPWVSGALGSEDSENTLAIGSGVAWQLSKEGKAGMLEFSGEGLSAIRDAMLAKKKEMATLGARLLEEASVPETATSVTMRHSGDQANLRTMTRSLELALEQALRWHSWWLGTEKEPQEIKTELDFNKEFFAFRMNSQDLQALVSAVQAELMSFKTFYHILTRGSLTRPGITAEEEIKAIQYDLESGLPESSKQDEEERLPSNPFGGDQKNSPNEKSFDSGNLENEKPHN